MRFDWKDIMAGAVLATIGWFFASFAWNIHTATKAKDRNVWIEFEPAGGRVHSIVNNSDHCIERLNCRFVGPNLDTRVWMIEMEIEKVRP